MNGGSGMTKKHMFPCQMWAMEDGDITRLKYDDRVFIREDVVKRDFVRNMISYPKSKPRKKNNSSSNVGGSTVDDYFKLFVSWMVGKEFVSPFRFRKEYPDVSDKALSIIISKLVAEKKLLQVKKDEFRVVSKKE